MTLDPASATTVDDATGSVAFDVDYAQVPVEADVAVVETQQDDHVLVAVDDANAVCVDKIDGDAPVAVANIGATGFEVVLPESGFVSCTVYNQPLSGVVADKRWVIDGVEHAEGDQPDGFTAQLTVSGPDGAPASEQGWGAVRGGYQGAQGVTADETVTLPEQCVLVAAEVTSVDGVDIEPVPLPFATTAANPARELGVTNRVVCPPSLTLVKEVVNDDGGTAVAQDWTLSASGPVNIQGVTGEAAVTSAAVEPGAYLLSEDGPEGYTSLGWVCVDDLTGAGVTVADDVVTVGEEDALTCTVTNDDDPVGPSPSPSPSEPAPGPSGAPGPTTAPPGGGGVPAGPGGADGPGWLPVTGGTIWGALAAALLLTVAGGALRFAVRRRRSA